MPRWFVVLLALCALCLTAAAGLHLRWRYLGEGAALDTWYSRICVPGRGCLVYGDTLHHRVVPVQQQAPPPPEDLIREYLAR